MTKKEKIWIKSMEFGHILGCHQMESRSFSFFGYQFPLCARCTGVLLGEILGIVSICFGIRLKWYIIIPLIAIMGIDWFIQYLQIQSSNNIRRLITGTLCGVGLTYCYFYGIVFVIKLIAKT